MLLNELEEFEGERVAVLLDLRDVAAALKTKEHAEDLGDGAVQPAGNLALGQTLRLVREQLDHVKPFFESRRGVVHYLFLLSGRQCAWLFHCPQTGYERTLDRVQQKTIDFHL